jgi:hypothetical protein
MRSIRRTLTGLPVLPKTQWNHVVLLRTRITTLRKIEIHINVKIDADALNRRRRRFWVRCKIYQIYQGQQRWYPDKCACVYSTGSVKNKIENETDRTNCIIKIS